MSDEQIVEEGGEPQEIQPGDGVMLTKEEYNNLIGTMTEMKLKLSSVEEDRRAAQVPPPAQPQPPQRPLSPDDIENMTKPQFASFILNEVGSKMAQPILELVMTAIVRDEIREVSRTHDDFAAYRDDVYKLTMDNPQLSIEKAYKLAKAENPDKGKKPEPKVTPPRPVGERPGAPRGAVNSQTKLSIRDAATKAVGDLLKDLPDD
jgi:hypothetical protein